MIKRILIVLTLFVLNLSVQAQEKVQMADAMRSNGRIYVVVAVVLTIFTFIILYLIRLDRKISRLEKNLHS